MRITINLSIGPDWKNILAQYMGMKVQDVTEKDFVSWAENTIESTWQDLDNEYYNCK